MKRTAALGVFVLALAVVFATASAPGAYAQDPKGGGGGGGQGSHGGGGGGDRGGGGGGGGGGAAGGGGMSASPSGGSSGGGAVWSGGGGMGSSPGMSAMPRNAAGGGNASGRREGAASPRWGGAAPAGRDERAGDRGAVGRSATDDQVAGRTRAGSSLSGADSSVPWYSRSRGANPSTGTAVPRGDSSVTPPIGGGGYPVYPWYPGYWPGYGGGYWGYNDCYYYYPYGCSPWGYGAFGMGYFIYSPFGWNYGDYSAWGGGGGGASTPGGAQMGSIRLKVKPNNASVYVDGYYAGTVDDFDNSFQKLSLALGSHRIEISAPGYQPLVFEINVRDFDTINYEGRLEPIR